MKRKDSNCELICIVAGYPIELGGFISPILQCVNCNKLFKINNDDDLIEINIVSCKGERSKKK